MDRPLTASPDCPHPPAGNAYAGALRIREALSRPGTHDPPVRDVTLIETHFAWVFLTDEHAYKQKKPIRAPGFDLRSLDSRARSCREEIRLNRRLAPDVYLGAVPVTCDASGRIAVNGTGRVVEWLVKMRRLPATRMLDRAIANGTVTAAALEPVARLLTGFYREAEPEPMTPSGYLSRLAARIDANRRELLEPDLHLDAERVESLSVLQKSAFERLAPQLADRARQRRIVEAHGDLRPEHVCLEPVAVIDSLEFARDLRILDPAEELAYLAVECLASGAAWVGTTLFDLYSRDRPDALPERLWHFYRSHRAATRAKLVAWHLRDPDYATREPWALQAARFLRIAEDAAGEAVRPG